MGSPIKISEDDTYREVMNLLNNDKTGELRRLLTDIVNWSRENPPKKEYDGFEWYQVYGDARTLNKLVTRRILEVRFKSNKSTIYRAVNVDAIERALNDYNRVTSIEAEEYEIPNDLFSVIVGHEDKKELLNRSIRSSEPIHFILWGSIASAKSLFLEELARLPKSKFILGSSLTKAGLFDILFSERPKYLIIDEIDKIDDAENLSVLLSLMERGFISETKYRRHRKLQLKTWVFASANRLSKIPPELLSRFGKLQFREYTDEEFMKVTIKVLTQREGVSEKIAKYIARKVLNDLDSRDVRDAVRVARLIKNESKEEVNHIINILVNQK